MSVPTTEFDVTLEHKTDLFGDITGKRRGEEETQGGTTPSKS